MEHLWAPWRMEYVERNKPDKETCVFCEAFSNPSLDRKNLVLFRGKYAFVILNLYPYSNGHILICSNKHLDTFEKLNDESFLRCLLNNAAKLANASVLNIASNKFEPLGVTAIALLAESHLSIHTWPESTYAAVDIFTCGKYMKPEIASQYLIETLMAKEHILRVIYRLPPTTIHTELRGII